MSIARPPIAIATVKSMSPGIVIDPCVLESSRRFLCVAAESNPPVIIFTSNFLLHGSAERRPRTASSARTATTAPITCALQTLKRADVHRLLDHISDVLLLLE